MDLQGIVQKPGKMLPSFVQRFCKAAYRIPNAPEAAVVQSFSQNVRDIWMREELAYLDMKTTNELYALASKCEKMEEGRRDPELASKAQDDLNVPKRKSGSGRIGRC